MSTYAEWAETHASDIKGDGWGSDHLWHHEATPSNASVYKCAHCFWPFAHYYGDEPDIFNAMQDAGVPSKCAREQMWPVRQEYANAEERQKWEAVRKARAAQPEAQRVDASDPNGSPSSERPPAK